VGLELCTICGINKHNHYLRGSPQFSVLSDTEVPETGPLSVIRCRGGGDPIRWAGSLQGATKIQEQPAGQKQPNSSTVQRLTKSWYMYTNTVFSAALCQVPGLTNPVSCPATTTHVSISHGPSSGVYVVVCKLLTLLPHLSCATHKTRSFYCAQNLKFKN
jgi:hypothetical protein